MFTIFIGSKYFHSNVRSWSILNLGNVHLNHIKINITPTIHNDKQQSNDGEFNSIRLAGYGNGQIAVGSHDSIYTKAISLKVNGELIVMVSADLLLMPPKVVRSVIDKLHKKSKIKREQIFFGATHTHASIGNSIPSFIGEKFEGEFQHEVVEWLSKKITNVIEESIADLKLSKIASDFVHFSDLVRNRIIGATGRLNDRFTIIHQTKYRKVSYYRNIWSTRNYNWTLE